MTKNPPAPDFDLFRLSKSKQAVDLGPNTIRGYAKRGLKIYVCGGCSFVSKTELADFIRRESEVQK